MLKDRRFWQAIGDYHFSLQLSRPKSPEMEATYQAFGTLCALALVHMKAFPKELSPALLEVVITNSVQSLDDPSFLWPFLPSAAQVAQEWPVNPHQPIPDTPVNSEVALNFN
ncbi:hypothetical protein F5878DRAFT_548404 [Lentinula raphanica]|uniref:Uncharacterized protein n=1 Tax=Lentinula raphanica TaxID=153919 RepID=A0AA38NX57_9AGAR|nr:hypothetical protein F5878DRAFT_548404 [Lentinula raphanica]